MVNPVEVIDVSPRDGLQNEPQVVSTEKKLALIDKLIEAGVGSIQTTSFAHPKWVPQMADAEAVAQGLRKSSAVKFSALVLNFKGYERAVAAGFRWVDLALSASETFHRRNTNQSTTDALKLLDLVSKAAERDGVSFRVGIAVSFHCPFEGRTPVSVVASRAREARARGAYKIGLSDTDGMAFPGQVSDTVAAVTEDPKIDSSDLVLHFHDTYGRALANVLAGLDAGVRSFDASVGGLGGCPFCPGASGNVTTEDLVAFVEGLGFSTGIDMEKLLDAAQFARGFTSRPYEGHLLKALRPHCDGAVGIAAQPNS
jgi:hydroxymethylglutaryl-CoA lyase